MMYPSTEKVLCWRVRVVTPTRGKVHRDALRQAGHLGKPCNVRFILGNYGGGYKNPWALRSWPSSHVLTSRSGGSRSPACQPDVKLAGIGGGEDIRRRTNIGTGPGHGETHHGGGARIMETPNRQRVITNCDFTTENPRNSITSSEEMTSNGKVGDPWPFMAFVYQENTAEQDIPLGGFLQLLTSMYVDVYGTYQLVRVSKVAPLAAAPVSEGGSSVLTPVTTSGQAQQQPTAVCEHADAIMALPRVLQHHKYINTWFCVARFPPIDFFIDRTLVTVTTGLLGLPARSRWVDDGHGVNPGAHIHQVHGRAQKTLNSVCVPGEVAVQGEPG
ncbi:hypothetical protein Bbelb_356740 [Branchiostoma belcheri]|nr:hypothetical protein Bbelb_356740 [Branchiostoma belcheri]